MCEGGGCWREEVSVDGGGSVMEREGACVEGECMEVKESVKEGGEWE